MYFNGKVMAGESRLAESYGVIPARNISAFLKSLFKSFSVSGDDFEEFISGNKSLTDELVDEYSKLDRIEKDKLYFDFGFESEFLKK